MAGDHLDTVKAGLLQAGCRVGIARDDFVDHRFRHLAWFDVIALVGHCRGRPGDRQGAVGAAQNFAAGMEKLAETRPAVTVDGVGQPGVTGNATVDMALQDMRGIKRSGMHSRDLDDDQARPTFGPRALIGDQLVARKTFMIGHAGVVAGRYDPVAQRRRADLQRRHQMGKCWGHEPTVLRRAYIIRLG